LPVPKNEPNTPTIDLSSSGRCAMTPNMALSPHQPVRPPCKISLTSGSALVRRFDRGDAGHLVLLVATTCLGSVTQPTPACRPRVRVVQDDDANGQGGPGSARLPVSWPGAPCGQWAAPESLAASSRAVSSGVQPQPRRTEVVVG
jgi:hypothetical protein